MAIQLPALGMQMPDTNAVAALGAGTQMRQNAENNQLELARKGMENISSIALGVLGGKMDGQADPALWEEAIGLYEGMGVDVSALKGRPDMASVVARAGVGALGQLQQANADRIFEQTLKEFDFQVQQAAQGPAPTAAMQNFEYAQANPAFSEFVSPSTSALPAPKQGYQWNPEGTAQTVIPGGPEDQPASQRELSAGEKKELFEAQDAVAAGGYVLDALTQAQALNEQAMDGFMAAERATLGANTPNIFGGNDDANNATIQYKNIVTELALNQLKTVFGGMPTEGERKILLEIQGSAEQPKEVRAAILARAQEMANRRIQDAQAKAEGIRTGQYMQPGYSPSQGTTPAAAGAVPAGVNPEDWQYLTDEERALWN